MRKLQLSLNTRDEADAPGLAHTLLSELDFTRAHDNGTVRVALRDDAARAIGQLPWPTFDVVLEYGLPYSSGDEPLLERAHALRRTLDGRIDPARSAAVLGDEIELIPGEGQFHLFNGIRRRTDMTLRHFRDYMLAIHSQYGTDPVERPGYRQLHTDPDATATAAEAAGVQIADLDMVAQLLLRDAGALTRLDPQLGAGALSDGVNFSGRRSTAMFTRVLAVIGPLAPQPAITPRLLPNRIVYHEVRAPRPEVAPAPEPAAES